MDTGTTSTAQEVADSREIRACVIRARAPPHQRASSNPEETGATSWADTHHRTPREFSGINGTRRPRHHAVHSPREADLRPRGYPEHQGRSVTGLLVQRQLHLADNRRPTQNYQVTLENGYRNANGQWG